MKPQNTPQLYTGVLAIGIYDNTMATIGGAPAYAGKPNNLLAATGFKVYNSASEELSYTDNPTPIQLEDFKLDF